MLDTSAHTRRRTERLRDPEFWAAYEQTAREIAQVDEVIRALDALRIEQDMSKAELARRVARNESSIRRLFSSHRSRPEFPLLATIAEALGARLEVVVTEPPKAKRPEKPKQDSKHELNAA
jgi:transcriptional regulator with XRE-family HTH domain